MQAIEISKPGPAEVLRVCERPTPEPGAAQVLIEVHAAGVNRPDILQRSGLYRPPPKASPLPGLEVAGVIIDGDVSGTDFAIGDEVCALTPGGGYAQYCCTPAAHCLPVPKGLSLTEAASLPETCFTVWSNVFERAGLSGDETLLIQGGSSGIGVTGIQIAHALGHRVFSTAGSEDKVQACNALGAHTINYKEVDFAEQIKMLTQGRGVDVILDMVGGDYVAREIKCLADDGRLVIIGLLGGTKAEVPLGQILLRRLTLTGSTLRPRTDAYKAAIAGQLREHIWPLIEAEKIKPVVYKTFPMTDAAEAHRLMESGMHIGKIVLTR